jgi:hypothetical protein
LLKKHPSKARFNHLQARLVFQSGLRVWEDEILMRALPFLCCLWMMMFPLRGHAGNWSVDLQVYSTQGMPTVTASVLGQRSNVAMTDQGDGVWAGTVQTPPAQLLPVTLSSGGSTSHDLVVLEYGDQSVAWQNEEPGQFQRASAAKPSSDIAVFEAFILLVAGVWTGLVGWLIIGHRNQRDGVGPEWNPSVWQSALFWLVMAVLWTWPAALANEWFIVGRHFDLPGTLWVIGAAPRLMGSLSDSMTAWPLGAELARLDSFLLVPISTALSWMSPGRIHGVLQILGVAVSALAAERFARAVGAKAPWTLIAGFGYAFSGLSANALLEGHVYHVFNPWLPLFGWMLWRAVETGSSRRFGIAAAGFYALCWLTTGYAGVVATMLCVAMLGRAKGVSKSALLAMGGCVAVAVAYALYFVTNGSGEGIAERLHPISAHLAGMLSPTPELDRTEHSLAPVLLAWMMALVILAPRVLGWKPGSRWQRLWWAGVLSLGLSMLPQLAASADLVLVRLEMDLLGDGFLASLLRFPARFGWLWCLCGGVVAAKVATQMSPRWGRAGWLLLAVVFVEAFVRVGTPLRQVARYGQASPILLQAEGPVLEMLPMIDDRGQNVERWLTNFSCMAQHEHGQVLTDDCVHTQPRQVRKALNYWLQQRLMSGQMEGVNTQLQSLGIRGIAFQPALFRPKEIAAFQDGLMTLDPRPLRDDSHGANVQLYTVGSALASAPGDAYESMNFVVPDTVRSDRIWVHGGGKGRFNGLLALMSWMLIAGCWTVAYRRS